MRSVSIAAAASIVTLVACASGGAGTHQSLVDDPSVPKPNEVVIYQFVFKPKVLRIPAGTTVSWINHDIAAHTTTRNGGADQFESGDMRLNRVFTHTFDTPGTYDYICFYHPGMKATVIVMPAQEAGNPGASSSGQSGGAHRAP